eukprot:scaffold4085_cov113-Isochrysis_galbana.AAC.2
MARESARTSSSANSGVRSSGGWGGDSGTLRSRVRLSGVGPQVEASGQQPRQCGFEAAHLRKGRDVLLAPRQAEGVGPDNHRSVGGHCQPGVAEDSLGVHLVGQGHGPRSVVEPRGGGKPRGGEGRNGRAHDVVHHARCQRDRRNPASVVASNGRHRGGRESARARRARLAEEPARQDTSSEEASGARKGGRLEVYSRIASGPEKSNAAVFSWAGRVGEPAAAPNGTSGLYLIPCPAPVSTRAPPMPASAVSSAASLCCAAPSSVADTNQYPRRLRLNALSHSAARSSRRSTERSMKAAIGGEPGKKVR